MATLKHWWVSVPLGLAMAVGCAAPGSTTGAPGPSGQVPGSSITAGSGSQGAGVPTTGPTDQPVLLEGTRWYQTLMINNGLSIRLAVDPERWIEFSDGELTFNGITERDGMGGGYDCPTLTVPATVVDDTIVYGDGAFDSEGARNICGTKVLLNPERGTVAVKQDGRELRVANDEGMNKAVHVFSADEPAAPSVPDSVDLSFLPAPTDDSVKDRLVNDVRGRRFVAEEVTGRTLVGDGVTMDFRVDQVGLNAGCNGGGAGYRVADEAIEFTGGAWTEMACEESLMEQEQWLMQFLSGTVAFQLDGEVLNLTKGPETVRLRETPPPDEDPTGEQATGAPGAAPDDVAMVQLQIDEVVTADGRHPMPELETGDFWGQAPNLTVVADAIGFDSGCGQQFAAATGDSTRSAGAYNGDWFTECPPIRRALSDALRYILSGELTIDRDGAFVTITGRDGIAVTAHSGF